MHDVVTLYYLEQLTFLPADHLNTMIFDHNTNFIIIYHTQHNEAILLGYQILPVAWLRLHITYFAVIGYMSDVITEKKFTENSLLAYEIGWTCYLPGVSEISTAWVKIQVPLILKIFLSLFTDESVIGHWNLQSLLSLTKKSFIFDFKFLSFVFFWITQCCKSHLNTQFQCLMWKVLKLRHIIQMGTEFDCFSQIQKFKILLKAN